MTRKYICDNCGKEIDYDDCYELKAISTGKYGEGVFGDFCWECLRKLEKFIKEGFQ